MFEPSKRVAQINRSLFLVPLESLVDRVLLERLSSGLDGRVVEIVVVLFVHGVQHVLELLQTVLLGLELADLGRGFLGKFLDLGGEIVEDCHDLILLLAVGADLAQLVQFVLELCDLGLQLVEIVLESAAFLEHLVGEFFFLLESLADDLVTLLVLLFPGGVHLGTFRRTKPLWLVGPVAAHVIVANAVVHLEPGDVAGRKPFIGAVELRSHARRGAWLIRAVGAVAVVVVDFVCGNDDLRVAQTPPKPVFVGLVDRLALWRDSSNPMGGGLDTKQNQCYH
ncbi:hypothetical protein OGAPHI_005022 [Ogataea philodendri]|uniref:Uncharacterized protein n=1 Tax=Ogataea philodendri TaxID=1378263 RepID=A0A9P8T3B1_9ASCO|nr:uncharacterized protein OGAPHI_005022 [Ogataea philodendri]KAH3663621.1 hypothetical protein OGAPHI_005022 [Ogataea philodendri]